MPTTTRLTGLLGLTATILLVGACGGAEGDGGGGGGAAVSARPPQEQIAITSADAAVPFQLQPGRYKFGWDASECEAVTFTMTGQTQGYTYEKTTRQKKFSAIISDVPEDTYMVAQTDPGCTDWTVQIDRIGS
jgi:hypothetical protein